MRSVTVPGDGPNVARVGREIPIPDVPVEPVLSGASLFPRGGRAAPSVLEAGHAVGCVTGRTAIARALECMAIEPGTTVLVPSYHNLSMVEPLAHVGARPVFYRIRADLSVDLEDLERRIDPTARAVMVVHYFGLPQAMRPIRESCDRHGLFLLEDCAHCFFGDVQGRPPGGWGDFAIASQRKFFPMPDGGLLVSRRPEIRALRSRGQGLSRNVRAAFGLVETAVRYGRLGALAPLVRLANAARPRRGSATQRDQSPAERNSGGPGGFEAAWVDRGPSLAARIVLALASKARVVTRRRANYRRLADALAGLPGCSILRPELPEGAVPYTFPIRIENLAEVFPRLEDAAIPMQRFGQFLSPAFNERTCPVAADLSRNAVQICCHQEITELELASVIERIQGVLRSVAASLAPPRVGAPAMAGQ